MFDYVLGDLHLGHENIIKYCDRPFNSADHMDQCLIQNWNEQVDPTDNVLYLGDLTLAPPEIALEYIEQLNGSITFIQGNHDRLKMKHESVHVFDSLTFTYQGIKFYCKHTPYNYDSTIPNQWLIHGHTHNNETEDYPFFDPGQQTINVSVELVDFQPISFDALLDYIENCSDRATTIQDVLQ